MYSLVRESYLISYLILSYHIISYIISIFSMLSLGMSPCYGMPFDMTVLVMIKWPNCMSVTDIAFICFGNSLWYSSPTQKRIHRRAEIARDAVCCYTISNPASGSNIVWWGSINRPTRLDEYSSRGHVTNMAAFILDVSTYALVRTCSHPIPNCSLGLLYHLYIKYVLSWTNFVPCHLSETDPIF